MTIQRKRTDRNQTEIVEYLRAHGAKVQSLAMVGDGVPDLIVCYQGVLALVEVKDGAKPPSERQLTTDQKRWWSGWDLSTLWLIRSTEDAKRMLWWISQGLGSWGEEP